MFLQVVGCSHHNAPIEVRERLSFAGGRLSAAFTQWKQAWPQVEAVFLSTCNRVEMYAAVEENEQALDAAARFLSDFHGIPPEEIEPHLFRHRDEEAVQHLFSVASSLDSMVLGETQIAAQVKEAYRVAVGQRSAGPMLHAAFQAALHVAHRVAGETALHRHRISIPSVAVTDFALQIFDRFDDKHVVVIGAGEMAEETLRYLREEGAKHITVVNRSVERADALALRWEGKAVGWDQLIEALATADLIVSATGAAEPIVTAALFDGIERARLSRSLCSFSTWPFRATSSRASANAPTSIFTRWMIWRRSASGINRVGIKSCLPHGGLSTRKRQNFYRRCIAVR